MTLIIVAITAIVSIMAFNNSKLYYKYIFNAYQVIHRKEWYRIFTHALLHGNWPHLIINMLVLFSFGSGLERYFGHFFGVNSALLLGILYISAILISSVYSLYKEKDNPYYNAVGASGAVSAVVFASIFFAPLNKVYFFGILPIPGIVFAGLYLGYSYYMSQSNAQDNIGHDAHFYGAVYGFIFPLLVDPNVYNVFINQLFG